MSVRKYLPVVPAVGLLLMLSACGTENKMVEAGDPQEVTCERFHGVIDEFSNIDPSSMGLGDILAHISDGFSEMESVADDAQDDQLAHSIDTLSETLNSSIAASGGDVDAVAAELRERMQEPEVAEAATYLDDVCGLELPF